MTGRYEIAEELAERFLQTAPENLSVRIIAAHCAAHRSDAERAAYHLDILTEESTNPDQHGGNVDASEIEVLVEGFLLKGRLARDASYDLRGAEAAFRRAINLAPSDTDALTELVRLLALSGRRREALPYLLELIRQNEPSDLLMIASRATASIQDPELLQEAYRRAPEDSRILNAMAASALQSSQPSQALEYSKRSILDDPDFAPAWINRGLALLQMEDHEQLKEWDEQAPEDCHSFAEFWQIKGYIHLATGNEERALRCFIRAFSLGPDLKDVCYRIARLLRKGGDNMTAESFESYLSRLQKLEVLQDRAFLRSHDTNAVLEMIHAFRNSGRLWEAFGWASLALSSDPDQKELLTTAADLYQTTRDLPLSLVTSVDSVVPEFDQFESLHFESAPDSPRDFVTLPSNSSASPVDFRFTDDAHDVGLGFHYINGVEGRTTHRMFEFTGGGIGVGDFDSDSYPDVFLTQGCLWANRGKTRDAEDQLFRNMRGSRFQPSSHEAGITDREFGQGVAVGDVNNDGFADVVVANIGRNFLWLNQGDGTFQKSFPEGNAEAEAPMPHQWSTSAAIADFDGDAVPDIYICNYLEGADVFERICPRPDGSHRACIPVHFEAASDTLLTGNGDGTFLDRAEDLKAIPPGKGLGLLACRFGSERGLSLLVANDTTPNMLLKFATSESPYVTDQGFASGLAVSAFGKPQGSMGIAAADLDHDGVPEIVVTNFYNEANAFYTSPDGATFEDQTRPSGMEAASLPLLGFGTQFLDVNADARFELFVANGHVDDLLSEGKPWHMPAQLFQTNERSLAEADRTLLGDYFQKDHLGRSVATIDWNCDLLSDLIVGHLNEDYALLTNRTSRIAPAVGVRMVATNSARDATGARIHWQLPFRADSQQVTAGDGYHASCQKEILLVSTPSGTSSELRIEWPSGHNQNLADVKASRRIVIRENCDRVFQIPF